MKHKSSKQPNPDEELVFFAGSPATSEATWASGFSVDVWFDEYALKALSDLHDSLTTDYPTHLCHRQTTMCHKHRAAIDATQAAATTSPITNSVIFLDTYYIQYNTWYCNPHQFTKDVCYSNKNHHKRAKQNQRTQTPALPLLRSFQQKILKTICLLHGLASPRTLINRRNLHSKGMSSDFSSFPILLSFWFVPAFLLGLKQVLSVLKQSFYTAVCCDDIWTDWPRLLRFGWWDWSNSRARCLDLADWLHPVVLQEHHWQKTKDPFGSQPTIMWSYIKVLSCPFPSLKSSDLEWLIRSVATSQKASIFSHDTGIVTSEKRLRAVLRKLDLNRSK